MHDDHVAWEQVAADIVNDLEEAIINCEHLFHDVRKHGRIGRRERQLLEAIEKLEQRAIALQDSYQEKINAADS